MDVKCEVLKLIENVIKDDPDELPAIFEKLQLVGKSYHSLSDSGTRRVSGQYTMDKNYS